MKCNLCKINVANQTGSHITSAFLLTSQIGKRGQEKNYVLSSNPSHNYSVNQGDSGLKENNILCRECEGRLSVIEDIFSREVTQKIENVAFASNFTRISLRNEYFKLNCKRIPTIAFHLFIQSIIWKASISTKDLFANFKLTPELEERIRINLDLFLPTYSNHRLQQSIKDWINMVEECKELFTCVPFTVIRGEKIENKQSNYHLFCGYIKNPYHIMINEYIINLFDNSLIWIDDFFGLKSDFVLSEIVNDVSDKAIITVISNERYKAIIRKIQDFVVRQRFQQVEMQCISLLRSMGISVTDELLKRMVLEKIGAIKSDFGKENPNCEIDEQDHHI